MFLTAKEMMLNKFKNKVNCTVYMVDLPKLLPTKTIYIKKLQKNTLEWIKEQPYFTKKIRIPKDLHTKSVSIIEEDYNAKYLE